MSDRKVWTKRAQESKVENFYATGIADFHDHHKGYLNFGYWTQPAMTYVEAAENLVRHLAERLGLNETSQLLDVGCGMGTQDVFLAKNFPLRSIDAIDVTWKHIELARERTRREGVPEGSIRFHHGTAVQMPFPSSSFTHIVSVEAPEHFDTRQDFFREAFRVLKPGGVMAIADFSLPRAPRNIGERALVHCTRAIWQVPKANLYGSQEYGSKLASEGFSNVVIDSIGQWTIPGYYRESRRATVILEMRKLRGLIKGVVAGYFLDRGVYGAYKRGLCDYIIVRCDKPSGD